MSEQQQSVVVLRDEDGQCYCLTPAMLDQARVPAEQTAAVEEALAGDVSGFAAYLESSPYATPLHSATPYQDRMLNPQPLPPRFNRLALAGIIVVGG